MVARLHRTAGIRRKLQYSESEIGVGNDRAGVFLVEQVHRVVERRGRPARVIGDRVAQRPLFGRVAVSSRLQIAHLVGVQRHEGFVRGRGTGGIRDAAYHRAVVVSGGQLRLEAAPRIQIVGRPEPPDRLRLILGGIDSAGARDGDRRPIDRLRPIRRSIAAPHPQLDAEVSAELHIVGGDLAGRLLDERRGERAAGVRLELRPGNIQHDLAEGTGIIRQVLGKRKSRGWRRGIVVELDITHIDKPGLRRLVTGVRPAHPLRSRSRLLSMYADRDYWRQQQSEELKTRYISCLR